MVLFAEPTMDQSALDRIPLLVRDSVQQYAGRVIAYGGSHVLGLMLYGPVAGPRSMPTFT